MIESWVLVGRGLDDYPFDHAFLGRVANCITNEVR
jgi:hypothetical protein